MSRLDLSKSQKKIARKVIEMGLQREFQNGITKVDKVISQWKSGILPNRETYHKMYEMLTSHDEHISRRYDDMTGSKYLLIIAGQLADGIITKDELNEFEEEVKESVVMLSGVDR